MCEHVSSKWEQVVSKVVALLGGRSSHLGVPFTYLEDVRVACEQLHSAGFPKMGREPMYSTQRERFHTCYRFLCDRNHWGEIGRGCFHRTGVLSASSTHDQSFLFRMDD